MPQVYHQFTKKCELMNEYHVDTSSTMWKYVRNKTMVGDFSVRKNKNEIPVIFVGQDEIDFSQHHYIQYQRMA